MQLYNVGTFYQLLNAVHIKMTMYPNEKADIILMDATDFTKQLKVLTELDVFVNIYDGKNAWNLDRMFKTSAKEKKVDIIKDFFENDCGDFAQKKYTDYFLGAQTPYFKMVYYALCQKNIYPKAHLIEDGIYTYVLDFVNDCNNDGFTHNLYGKHDIRKNLGNVYAYGSKSMYFGSDSFEYKQIPNLYSDDLQVKKEIEIYQKLWGKYSLPQEKYIFLEEGMFQDHLISADIVLLEQIAEMIGKENIIVKRHPRCRYDRFSERGFNVLKESGFPWELLLMDEDADRHVIISLSSTATTTGKTVLGKDISSVLLYSVKPFGEAGPHCRLKTFDKYAKTLEAYMNEGERVFFIPNTIDELKEILVYIEARDYKNE